MKESFNKILNNNNNLTHHRQSRILHQTEIDKMKLLHLQETGRSKLRIRKLMSSQDTISMLAMLTMITTTTQAQPESIQLIIAALIICQLHMDTKKTIQANMTILETIHHHIIQVIIFQVPVTI